MNPIVMYKDEAIVEEFSIEDFKKRKAGFRRNSTRSGKYSVIPFGCRSSRVECDSEKQRTRIEASS